MSEPARTAAALPWRVEEVDFSAVDAARARDDETLFFLLASASFVETGADIYTRNLLEYYCDDAEAAAWLSAHWEQEELQHGRALKTYVRQVWPEFDWETAFARFFEQYSATCSSAQFEATPALELAARCVVETGTATYYRMLLDYTREPVLRQLLERIRSDEVRHFKHFYHYFRRYQQTAKHGRLRVAGTLWRRLRAAMNEDGHIAFRHAYAVRHPGQPNTAATYAEFRRKISRIARAHYPYGMGAEMLLTPLALPGALRRPSAKALGSVFRLTGFR